jgi:hypothetical protein
MSKGQRTEHNPNRKVSRDVFQPNLPAPQTATGGSGKKPPKKPRTTFGKSNPDPYGGWHPQTNPDYFLQGTPPQYRENRISDLNWGNYPKDE